MADDGYEEVVSIDISSVVIQAMQSKYSNRPHLKCTYVFLSFKFDVFMAYLFVFWLIFS